MITVMMTEEEEEDTDVEGFSDHDSINVKDPSYDVVNQHRQQEETNHEEEVSCEDQEDEGIVYPLKVTKHECERHINLLLTEEDGVHNQFPKVRKHISTVTRASTASYLNKGKRPVPNASCCIITESSVKH